MTVAVRPTKKPRNSETPNPRTLRTVGLFAGVGGLELGLNSAGHETLAFCEIEPAAQAVLRTRFPDIPVTADVLELEELPRKTQLITAGFPCQDLSQAGRTLGLKGSRSGLVGEVFRLLRTNDVPWVLLENVPFMLQLAKGEALRIITENFEELGYKWAYRVINSRAFGLPQRRERVYLLASRVEDPRSILLADDAGIPEEPSDLSGTACGFYWTEGTGGLGWAVDAIPTLKGGSTIGIASPPAIWLPGGEIVTPGICDAERMQGFAADWTKPAEEVARPSARWKLVGNAVTVNVAEWIGRRLALPGSIIEEGDRSLQSGRPWPRAAYNIGHGIFSSSASAWPVRRSGTPLVKFLNRDQAAPLSLRATSGFLSRFEKSTLRRPPGFIEAVRAHKLRMEQRQRS